MSQPGKYRITLRQWPKEAKKEIVGGRAKIKIGGINKESSIRKGSYGVDFEFNLPEGTTELWTYIYNQKEEVGGAYFTEVNKL